MKFSIKNILILACVFVLGYAVARKQFQPISTQHVDTDLFWQTWRLLDQKYPFKKPSNSERMHGAIQGLVNSFEDDYSVFLPPAESEFLDQNIAGEFGGIGAEITIRGGFLSIVTPLKGSPAETAGVLPGDIVTHVDGVEVAGETLDESISRIRGGVGEPVVLTIVRYPEPEPVQIDIIRDIVQVPVLDTQAIDDVFVISLYNFNDGSEDAFRDALLEFKDSGLSEILIDVRNNPGGYLVSVIDMLSYFVPQGEILVREQIGPSKEDQDFYRSLGYDLLFGVDYSVSVLVNEGSASASEILAGALRDINQSVIFGETTFGKGSVQELIELENGTALKVTVAKWLTPLNLEIDSVGITPDVYIEFDYEGESDNQLDFAINYINENK